MFLLKVIQPCNMNLVIYTKGDVGLNLTLIKL